MKIYSLSKILLLPILFIAFGIYYYAENIGTRDDTVWFFIPAFLLVLILIFGPQIDFWWHKKYPIPLDPRLKEWLVNHLDFYNNFDAHTKNLFEQRLGLYIEAREFKSVGSELRDVPEDIKASIASIPVQLSLNDEDFLLGDYDRIYVYSHPFPSPKMPFLHTLEVDHEDGLILFSLEQLLPGILDPEKYFPIGLYVFLEVYFSIKKFQYPTDIDWDAIEKSGIYTRTEIEKTTGRKDLIPAVILGILYFVKSDFVYTNHPKYYGKLNQLFHHTGKTIIIQ